MKSMTGYGRGEAQKDGYCFVIEMRSVNHRFCEVMVKGRVPLSIEEKIKAMIKERIKRGRVDVRISVETTGQAFIEQIKVDKDLAMAYYKELMKLKEVLQIDGITIKDIVSLPGVLETKGNVDELENYWEVIKEAADNALEQLLYMRSVEGAVLADDIKMRMENIRKMNDEIAKRSTEVVNDYRNRLKQRVNELVNDVLIDEGRLELEVVFFAEKSNITEEIVRFNSHIDQAYGCFNTEEPVGRRLDFLLQEMNREVNTIASKAADCKISEIAVNIKSELEKIREQVQNVE
ncbi:YicC family protein [Peptococcaceae bacterium]|nr:YicC family protein [Peptococcaceae bacterium]